MVRNGFAVTPARRRIVALVVLELTLLAGGLLILVPRSSATWHDDPRLFVGYAVVMTILALLPRITIEHRNHGTWLTPTDSAIVVGLFLLGPLGFVAAASLGDVALALRERQSPLKTLFNLASGLGGYTTAAVVFVLLGRSDPLDPVAWLGALLALAACSLWDLVSTAAVLAIAEGQQFLSLFRVSGLPVLVSLILSGILAIPALVLFSESPLLVLLLAPVLGILLVSTRGMSLQRAERVRFERLYDAASRLTQLTNLQETLGRGADEARTLANGAIGLSIAVGADGDPTGMLVDGDGIGAAPPALMAEVLDRLSTADRGTLDADVFGPVTRRRLPDVVTMVWARRPIGADADLLIAVFRELRADEPDDYRADVLAAFATQAATVVANVELHEDVQRSLGHQLELNRQKSEFVAAVSHELRTPLASILSAVQTVQRLDERMSPDQRAHVLELGWSQGKRLHGLIEDLLLVAAADHREVPCEQRPVDLAALVGDLERELQAVVDDRLVIDLAADATQLISDEDKVRRILINLVTNAGKYAPTGPIVLSSQIDGDDLVVAVTDRGPGIPADDVERIFDRFVQLDQSSTRSQGGTGLGLHLSRQLAELLGADLALCAGTTGGARFELRFPQASTGSADGPSGGSGRSADAEPVDRVGRAPAGSGIVGRPDTSHRREDARLATVAREG